MTEPATSTSGALLPEPVIGNRIVLTQLSVEALAAMPWLAGSLAPDWAPDALERAVDAEQAVLIADASGAPIGAAVVAINEPETGMAAIPFISIDPVRRYRGLGGEGALALERHIRSQFGVEKVCAAIPDWRGLAVYFWLRQGYRPVTLAEAPWPLVGLGGEARAGIWMLRASP